MRSGQRGGYYKSAQGHANNKHIVTNAPGFSMLYAAS